jgi:hypothetical protein
MLVFGQVLSGNFFIDVNTAVKLAAIHLCTLTASMDAAAVEAFLAVDTLARQAHQILSAFTIAEAAIELGKPLPILLVRVCSCSRLPAETRELRQC